MCVCVCVCVCVCRVCLFFARHHPPVASPMAARTNVHTECSSRVVRDSPSFLRSLGFGVHAAWLWGELIVLLVHPIAASRSHVTVLLSSMSLVRLRE